jgi:hypothetical protein
MSARKWIFAVFLLVLACGKNATPPIQFTGLCAPPSASPGQPCIYTSPCANHLLGRPLVDVAYAFELAEPIEYTNVLMAETTPGATRFHDVVIERHTITYQGVTATPVTVYSNLVIAAGTTQADFVQILPHNTLTELQGNVPALPITITAQVTAHGTYNNGSSFSSGPEPIAIDVCNGCLADVMACPCGKTLQAACPSGAIGVSTMLDPCGSGLTLPVAFVVTSPANISCN